MLIFGFFSTTTRQYICISQNILTIYERGILTRISKAWMVHLIIITSLGDIVFLSQIIVINVWKHNYRYSECVCPCNWIFFAIIFKTATFQQVGFTGILYTSWELTAVIVVLTVSINYSDILIRSWKLYMLQCYMHYKWYVLCATKVVW